MIMMPLVYYGISDIGLVRSNNEDCWNALPADQFFVLADGMGGHNAGEVASSEAVSFLCKEIQNFHSGDDLQEKLKQAIIKTNSHVFDLSQKNKHFRGMGTTLCCILVQGSSLIYGHVGDSRIYRFREKLERMTEDHSLSIEIKKIENGSPRLYTKNIITRCIGNKNGIRPELNQSDALPGDIYLLCSDGLTDYLSTKEMEQVIKSSPNLEKCCQKLVQIAKEKGGSDNITILMVKIVP